MALEGWKKFWNKIFNFLAGRMDEKAIRRVTAAFGSFLLVGLTGFTPVITFYVEALLTNTIVSSFFIGLWIAFVGFMGVLIVSFFGTTETLPEEDRILLNRAKEIIKEIAANPEASIEDAAAGLAASLIDEVEE